MALALASAALGQNHPELEWRTFETEHFRFHYHAGLEQASQKAATVAEGVYGPVTRLYGYEPSDKVRIIMKGYDDYANGAAYFYHDTIEIWTTALEHDFDLRGSTDWLSNVIAHEFVHIVSLGASRKGPQRIPALYLQYFGYQRENNRPDVLVGYPDVLASYPLSTTVVPMWFAEGIAQYQAAGARHDRWDSHRDMVLRTAVLNESVLDYDQMGVFAKRGFGNEYVYDHGYGLARYIAATYGDKKLAEICRAAAAWPNLSFDGAIERSLGLSPRELHEEWYSAMRSTYSEQEESLGELWQGEAITEKGFSNLRPSYSPDGRYLAYLSTQGRDYGPHLLLLRDLESDEEEVLTGGVTSTVGWSPDSRRLLFVRIDKAGKYGSRQADIYEYDLDGREATLGGKLLWTLPALVAGYAPEKPQIRRLSRGLRAMYPSFSPDGEWIVFVHNEGTSNNLGLMRLDGSDIRYLTEYTDGTQLFTPAWSPDSRRLAVSIGLNGQRDLALIEVGRSGSRLATTVPMIPESATSIETLVATDATERDPAWLSDGTEVIFSSDVSGIFNIYGFEPATGRVRQLTNVIGGAHSPSVSKDDQQIAFVSYGVDGYGIRAIELPASDPGDNKRPTALPASFEHNLAEPSGPGGPASANVLADGLGAHEQYGIDFLPTSFLPRLMLDEGRFKGGVYVTAGDVLSKQTIFAGVAVAPTNGDRDLFFIYENRNWRPTIFVEFFNQQRQSTRGDSSAARDLVVNEMRFQLNQLNLGLKGKLGKKSELALSLTYDRYDAILQDSRATDGRTWINQKPFGYTYLNGFDFGLTYRHHSVTRSRDRQISPRGGRSIEFRYDRMFNKFIEDIDVQSFIKEEFRTYQYNQLTLDWKEYVGLPANTTLGLRLYSGWIASDAVDDEIVDDFFDYHLGGLPFMKGYTFYSLEGRKALMGQASWRFPILSQTNRRFLQLYLDNVYGAVYSDVGKAWDGDFDAPDPVYGRRGPLRDFGAQLRFDLISYYNFPTKVQMDLAYGVDEVEDNLPWKFYLTVLFGYL